MDVCTQVTGSVFAADSDPPTPINLTTAISGMQTGLHGRRPGLRSRMSSSLGTGTLRWADDRPSLYKWIAPVTIPADLTIAGAANVWIAESGAPSRWPQPKDHPAQRGEGQEHLLAGQRRRRSPGETSRAENNPRQGGGQAQAPRSMAA
jgi:hypothetical protein